MSTEDKVDYQQEDTVNAIKDAVTGGKLKYDGRDRPPRLRILLRPVRGGSSPSR